MTRARFFTGLFIRAPHLSQLSRVGLRLKLVTVKRRSRIRQLEPEPLPIDPAGSEQLGSQPAWRGSFGISSALKKTTCHATSIHPEEEMFYDASSINAGTQDRKSTRLNSSHV